MTVVHLIKNPNHMAEINNTAPAGGRQSFARPKIKSTKVDLTPMVDLGFLLITFFIVSTTMQQQRALKFFLPADGEPTNIPQSTALTLVPVANNQVCYFYGDLSEAIRVKAFGKTSFSLSDGIGQVIRDKKKQLKTIGREKDLMVLIYPDQLSTYKNVVDLLDEMLINDVHRYCIADNAQTISDFQQAIKDAGK
jgi:biopolymer transport protein ExbD